MWLRAILLLAAVLPAAAQTTGWREAALARIEKIRKDTLTVRVVHRDGKPAAGVTVKATLLEHEFGFGTAVAAGELFGGGEDSERYRAFIRNNFNMAVLENDLKWPQWDRDRKPALDAVAWLRANGISRVRGHTLVWPGWRWLPRFLKPLESDPPALRERVRAHIEDIVTANRGTLVHWDVLNEPFTNHDLMDLLGSPVMAEWFREARRRDPDALLFINDYNILSAGGQKTDHQDHYHRTVRSLIEQGAPLDGIGMQGHFTQTTPPERMLEILDRFGEFGLPIAITEFDFQTKDEAAQAAFFRDFLTVCFSHPRVRWFLMWGFWEGRHWRPDGAMIRRDWSPKPAYEVWRDLIFHQWWTRAEAVTDDTGTITLRGFHGRYGVTAFGAKARTSAPVMLPAGGAALTLTLP